MYKVQFKKYLLKFKKPSGTSRGVIFDKTSWFIKISQLGNPSKFGIGECGPIDGLSIDNSNLIDNKLQEISNSKNQLDEIDLTKFPSINFGLEMALKNLESSKSMEYFNNPFSKGRSSININGLIWMGNKEEMTSQIKNKIEAGFRCLKLKIGAISFDDEIKIIKQIRENFKSDILELRVDANGAFDPNDVMDKLNELDRYDIHSIEQPIPVGKQLQMKNLCLDSPIDIALDEELIGVEDLKDKENLLESINPQYIILKPSLLGGFKKTNEWISVAEKNNIKWWITSALESNIGLNAIAQYAAEFNNPLPQGLGTGQIYSNNITSYLEIKGENLKINHNKKWDLSVLKFD